MGEVEIPESGQRDLGVTFSEINRGLHYNKPKTNYHHDVRYLWPAGVDPREMPPGFMQVAIWPTRKNIREIRAYLKDMGLRLAVSVEDIDKDTYMMRARYSILYKDWEQQVTCEAVVILFPVALKGKAIQFKLRFGPDDGFDFSA